MSQRETLTILFADVSGSTKLFETRGDEEARRIVGSVLAALAEIVERHGGRIVKTIGDELMCTFPDALHGLLSATEMQRRVKSDTTFLRDRLGIRIGLHHGEALVEDSDVFGDAVNTAARVVSLANRDQIVATASAGFGIAQVAGLRVRSLGSVRVAGKLAPIELVDVLWQGDLGNVTAVDRVPQQDEAAASRVRLTLRYENQEFEIDELSPPFTLGRETGNSLIVKAEWISRNHATIEWRRNHFVLADRSTNGTWVRMGEDDELLVHRDEVHLRKAGTISLGRAYDPESRQIVHFQLD